MNQELERLKKERDRLYVTDAKTKARLEEVEKRISELEKTEIYGIVRMYGLTIDELAEFLKRMKKDPCAEPDKNNGERNDVSENEER